MTLTWDEVLSNCQECHFVCESHTYSSGTEIGPSGS